MSNYQTGHDAEKLAADYLKNHGFRIHQLNWKTRFCEIDIVAEKDKVIYFVEVKSRRNATQGSGLDYITTRKLHQMDFAAKLWLSAHNYDNDCRLAALAFDGGEPDFIEID